MQTQQQSKITPEEVRALSREANNYGFQKDDAGSITVQFGGGDGMATNSIPISPGWNYWARFYIPRKEILDGT